MYQCEELRINCLSLLLVVTMPYACWFLWWVDYIEDFKWRLHFAIRGCVLKGCSENGIYLKGPIAFEGHWRLQSLTLIGTLIVVKMGVHAIFGERGCGRMDPLNRFDNSRGVWLCGHVDPSGVGLVLKSTGWDNSREVSQLQNLNPFTPQVIGLCSLPTWH